MPHPDPKLVESIACSLTKDFIRQRYPDEAPHVILILEELVKQQTLRLPADSRHRTVPKLLDMGLPFDGEEMVKLITPAAFLIIVGAVEKLSAVRVVPPLPEIQQALKDSARKAGASEPLANGLADVVGVELHTQLQLLSEASSAHRSNPKAGPRTGTEAECLVWVIQESDETANRPIETTWNKVQSSYLTESWKRKCQILVVRGSVSAGRDQRKELVDLENREYRLLLMFLINKGFHLNPAWLHRKAWTKPLAYRVTDDKDIMQHLKVPVSALRQKLSSVPRFEINKKERGYICTGRFSACVILSRSESEEFKYRGS